MSVKNIWSFIKRNPNKVIFLPPLFYICMTALTIYYSSAGEVIGDCKKETEKLGGGIHNFSGHNYNFTLCNYSGYINRDTRIVRLQIHDAQNELWVERFFDVDWNTNNYFPLEYTNTSVTYFDGAEENDYKKVIEMPPKNWERFEVKIKHSFWGVMQNIFLNPIVNWLNSTFPPEPNKP
jgi:hypothetical protein